MQFQTAISNLPHNYSRLQLRNLLYLAALGVQVCIPLVIRQVASISGKANMQYIQVDELESNLQLHSFRRIFYLLSEQ